MMIACNMKFNLIILLAANLMMPPCLAIATPVKGSLPSKKTILAKDLIHSMELDQNAINVVNNTAGIFKNPPRTKDLKNQAKMNAIYASAGSEYEKQKKKIGDDLIQNMQKLLSDKFSEDELTYLIKIAQYKPAVKLRQLLASEEFNKLLFAPNHQGMQILQNVRDKNASSLGTK